MTANKYATTVLLLMVFALVGTYLGKAVGLGFFILGGLIILSFLVSARKNEKNFLSPLSFTKNAIFILSGLTLISFGWSSMGGIVASVLLAKRSTCSTQATRRILRTGKLLWKLRPRAISLTAMFR